MDANKVTYGRGDGNAPFVDSGRGCYNPHESMNLTQKKNENPGNGESQYYRPEGQEKGVR